MGKVIKIVEESDQLTLVLDEWTNAREHIINFVVKAPSRPSFLYKSINTTGITQNAENVSEAIIKILRN